MSLQPDSAQAEGPEGESGDNIDIVIRRINNESHAHNVSPSMTVAQLKTQIKQDDTPDIGEVGLYSSFTLVFLDSSLCSARHVVTLVFLSSSLRLV